ncbi:hypothetical protein [Mycolicibacterium moriokaense]|uniref:Uncharacterized protein n=1 Tax=Mycolicibacterium moriokaense TaxID=39691 RepID=A0A318H7U7_9MYCO|nr:hypothetical protein [Mycolicibacterium moriokaense]PXX00383.1 hypothetical protein C8E89_13435 [Mycolicibacterium moriokaense]
MFLSCRRVCGHRSVRRPRNHDRKILAPLPIAVGEYDPATGQYVGQGSRVYTHTDLAADSGGKTWQQLPMPPNSN